MGVRERGAAPTCEDLFAALSSTNNVESLLRQDQDQPDPVQCAGDLWGPAIRAGTTHGDGFDTDAGRGGRRPGPSVTPHPLERRRSPKGWLEPFFRLCFLRPCQSPAIRSGARMLEVAAQRSQSVTCPGGSGSGDSGVCKGILVLRRSCVVFVASARGRWRWACGLQEAPGVLHGGSP